jgi:nicotinate-nucleotide pyrophosphorylase (carboxylating)
VERTVLNFLQRLCGVATMTRAFVQQVSGSNAAIVDTRKTTPGWRTLEKKAVTAGGGTNHRFCLGTGILIKDNHVDAGGGVVAVVQKARAGAPAGMLVQVEVRTLAELDSAIEAHADMVLLDNMTNAMMAEAVVRARAAGIVTEASGGVTLDSVRGIAQTGVDRISIGALTHSAPSVDISMKVKLC